MSSTIIIVFSLLFEALSITGFAAQFPMGHIQFFKEHHRRLHRIAVVHRIGFFDEARLHGIEPVILFVTDADPRAEKAFALLRCSFPDLSLLPVRNRAAMKDEFDRQFAHSHHAYREQSHHRKSFG